MNNFKEKVKTSKDQLKKQYRTLKDKINPKIGSKLYLVSKISLSVIFFILVPVLFTTLSTLAGNEKIAYQAYEAVQWTIGSLLLIFLIMLFFFREYPSKVLIDEKANENSEEKSKDEKEKSTKISPKENKK